MKQFIFSVFTLISPLAAEYKTEGFSSVYDHEKRLFLMSSFLPARPTILALNSNPEIHVQCANYWPEAPFFYLDTLPCERCHVFDLLWLEGNGLELDVLSQAGDFASRARLIYTTIDLSENGTLFQRLKSHLEFSGFQLLTCWYWAEQKGHALFLRKDFYEATRRTLSYTPTAQATHPGAPFAFEPFLRPAKEKSNSHSMEGIDFIYMINLDERPEKFARSANELQMYGIHPYRFSAVNGWKIPTSAFDQIGAKFTPGSLRETFIGSTRFEEEGKQYIHTELLQENGKAYFSYYLARGAIGIVLSHLSILKDAYDAGYETIWVMEDDIDVLEDPRQIPGLLKKLDQLTPGWDIFFTDVDTKDTQGCHVPCRALAARPNVPILPLASFLERFYPIGDNFYRTGMRYGAYSMILRRSGIKKILDYYRAYRVFIPYDMDFWLCPDLAMYYFNCDIVSHRAGSPSDNSEPTYKR